MIQVIETTMIGDSTSHKIMEYARGATYTIDPNEGLHLYSEGTTGYVEFAYYAKGAFSSVVIFKK
jgi:hypothetical protein